MSLLINKLHQEIKKYSKKRKRKQRKFLNLNIIISNNCNKQLPRTAPTYLHLNNTCTNFSPNFMNNIYIILMNQNHQSYI